MRGMSTNTRSQSRIPGGVPSGGQWAEGRRAESGTASLTQDPRWSAGNESGYQAALAQVQQTLGQLSPQQRVTPGASEPQDDQAGTDSAQAAGDQAHDDEAGGVASGLGEMDSTDTTPIDQRDHTQRAQPYTADTITYNDIFPAAVSVDDDTILNGRVYDTVDSGGRVYHRRRAGIYPEAPSAIRLQVDRPLGSQEVEQLRNLMGYQLYAKVAPKPTGRAQADSPFSFTFTVDTSEVSAEKMDQVFDDWERSLPTTFSEGTPQRKTQGGTRKYEGLAQPPTFEVFYDRVAFDAQECADHLNGVRDWQIEAQQQQAQQPQPSAAFPPDAHGFQQAPPPMPPIPPQAY
jgi:hypothetical protein